MFKIMWEYYYLNNKYELQVVSISQRNLYDSKTRYRRRVHKKLGYKWSSVLSDWSKEAYLMSLFLEVLELYWEEDRYNFTCQRFLQFLTKEFLKMNDFEGKNGFYFVGDKGKKDKDLKG